MSEVIEPLEQMCGTLIERKKALRAALSKLPRRKLGHFPTPLDKCERFSASLGGVSVWVKRDDCSGLAFGGNKTRQLQFVLGDALASGADVIIQGAASQSNHSRQVAAASAKLGVKCVLMPRQDKKASVVQGNALIARLFGAEIEPVPNDASMKEAKDRTAARLREAGHTPFVVGMGAERALTLAALAYIDALLEIVDEFEYRGEPLPTHIYTTSQGSTQAGLLAGARLLGLNIRVVGINPMDASNEAYVDVSAIEQQAIGAAALVGYSIELKPGDVENCTDFVAPGYGLPSPEGQEAIAMMARLEGMLFDPVYSGKGLSGMVGHIRSSVIPSGARVVFIHTGGLPALFSYSDEMLASGEA
ncbi:pyridoxal-phosphate dependent enzyme [Paraburkholderia sp. Ac-20340]|uniref:pyridoxal-phosphate dependent enzyme n=1 Tax=Paraburkholderia sp. Ac-20340 TaxID=2703888 RepID=UPI00197D306B|nr:pyridoxal-phosphate dependent enzyme [Paraburkholderia sp. Ac-20340]MBN3853976.1 pyridoxal-phosphate dependent enzyme [Paraburkholderia sp. Ac-20340]